MENREVATSTDPKMIHILFALGLTVVVVVGKRLPPLQSHAFEWVRDWVRVIAALHHAIDKVE